MIWVVYGPQFLQEGHAWLESPLYNCLGPSWGKEGTQLQDLIFRANEMAQPVKMLATKPDNPSSIPGSHIMGREKRDSCKWSSGFHTSCGLSTPLMCDNKNVTKKENKTFTGDGHSRDRHRPEGWRWMTKGQGVFARTTMWLDLNSHTVFHRRPQETSVSGIYTMAGWLAGYFLQPKWEAIY